MANDKNTCFLFHKWDGCTCSVCGKVRDADHSYFWRRCSLDDCVPVCTKCGKALQSARAPHDFRRMEGDCRTACVRCGEKGRPEHQFEQAEGRCVNRCRICGYEQEIPHRWREIRERCELVCTVCGESGLYEMVPVVPEPTEENGLIPTIEKALRGVIEFILRLIKWLQGIK